MEFDSILHFLENKSILLTGATGYLAKDFEGSAKCEEALSSFEGQRFFLSFIRFNTEVIEKELFKMVKEKYGAKFNSFIHEKVTVLSGDVTREYLGLESSTLEELFGHVEIVINLAATTNFDERYDIALGINTFGPANVLSFSKKCRKLRVFLHVSTAYVCGEKEGLIMETPLKMGDSLNGTRGLDIEVENIIIQNNMQQLRDDQASQDHIKSMMIDLGFQRARKYGWPNAYSFTKAMGEMVLGELKNNIPLVIIRPTIITTTIKEPFPGWAEGSRHVDGFTLAYGKGKLRWFAGDPQTILDLIPVDMVVNVMVASMAAHADEAAQTTIYHVGSSMSNPVTYHRLQDYVFRFFTEQPWVDKNGNRVVVERGSQLVTRSDVRRYMALHYLIPLRILGLVNSASCNYFRKTYLDRSRKVMFFMRLVELFNPYVFFKGVFDDMNTEKLRRAIKERCGNEELEIFYFDPKTINWENYFIYTHIAGVVKYAFNR